MSDWTDGPVGCWAGPGISISIRFRPFLDLIPTVPLFDKALAVLVEVIAQRENALWKASGIGRAQWMETNNVPGDEQPNRYFPLIAGLERTHTGKEKMNPLFSIGHKASRVAAAMSCACLDPEPR